MSKNEKHGENIDVVYKDFVDNIDDSLIEKEIKDKDIEDAEDMLVIKNGSNPYVPPGRRTCEFVLEEDNTVKLIAYHGNEKQECMCVASTEDGDIDFSMLGKTFGMFTAKHQFTSVVVEDDRINRWMAEDLFEV